MGARLLAIDIGAESGRGIVGTVSDSAVTLTEVHRFPNRPFRMSGSLYWDVFHLYAEIVDAIGKAAVQSPLAGIGIDTWAVDYVLLGPDDTLLGPPFHYRDGRVDGVMEEAFSVMPASDIYSETGIQFLPINTLYQLLAARRSTPGTLAAARSFLMMGEYFTFLLTGMKAAEFTNASTTQLLNPWSRTWSPRLFSAFNLPMQVMPTVVEPGTVLGRLIPDLAHRTGAGPVDVIVPAIHDTGSAVAAVPGTGADWCYISSGTWSLLGVEVGEPIINETTFAHGLTNEGGVGNTFRLLKNVMGLWLLQECRRTWAAQGQQYFYAELANMGVQSAPFQTVINPDDARFLAPGDMPAKITAFARETGQKPPNTPGAFVRCILESLALKYRYVIACLEEATGRDIRVIHVVGGGSENELLNRLTADCTGCLVVAGPTEATAAGNVLVQALATGLLGGLSDARALVRRSFPLREYEPEARGLSADWDEAYRKLLNLLARRMAS